MIELLVIRKFFSSIIGFWDKLPTSIKVLIFIGVAFLGGFVWGTHKTTQKYEARIEQSVQEAKRIDKEANDTALKNMIDEKSKWQKQALDAENKLSDAAIEYSQMKEVCKSNDKFVKDNNDIDKLLSKQPLRNRK
jgi:hypothetical protein